MRQYSYNKRAVKIKMDEKAIKSMIEQVLNEMVSEQVSSTPKETQTKQQSTVIQENVTDLDTMIPDITEVDLKTQYLVSHPKNGEAFLRMKQHTPARLGLWRAGTRYLTEPVLRFRADHASAQDAVFSNVSEELIEDMHFVPVQTLCQDKDEYVTRPDLGRQFSSDMAQKIKEETKHGAKVQIVVGDGLSSAAIEANIREILPAIEQGLKTYGIETGPVLFVKYCRVPAMDPIGEITDADVVCLLIGERPGLVTAESMSAYIAYKPTIGMPEARRTVVSNIHKGGTGAVEAGAYISELIKKMLDKKKSGIDLKEGGD